MITVYRWHLENHTTSLRSWKCTPFGAFGTTFPPEGALVRWTYHCLIKLYSKILPRKICIMCSFQIIEPSPLHDIVQPFGPSPPLGGDAEGRGGVFPRPLGRFYGFLNDYGIPLAFRKPYNLASLVEMHHLSPGGGTGPMDLSLVFNAIA